MALSIRQLLNLLVWTPDSSINITPAIKYLNIVIPAKAGIQVATGCRIKSGMTELDYLIARLIMTILFFWLP